MFQEHALQVAGVTTRTRYSQCGNQRTSLPELDYLSVESVWAGDIAPRDIAPTRNLMPGKRQGKQLPECSRATHPNIRLQ